MTKISIIIPLYNKATTVKKTIDSILSQDYPNFEIIIINDGSTDNSVDVVNEIKDSRIHLISKENGGVSSARNYGVRCCNYDWVCFLDADDFLTPGALKRFSEAVSKTNANLIVGNHLIVEQGVAKLYSSDYKSQVIHQPFRELFYGRLMPRAGAAICAKSLLMAHPFNESITVGEDLVWILEVLPEARVYRLDYAMMTYCRAYSEASHKKSESTENSALGNLNFDIKKPIWEKLCMYKFFVLAKNLNPDVAKKRYAFLRYRPLLKLSYYFAFWAGILSNKFHCQ